jgi:hypothetical protein
MNLKDFLINEDNIEEGIFSSAPKEEKGTNKGKAAGLVYTALDRYLNQSIATHNSINSGVVGKMMEELDLKSERTKILRDMNDMIRVLEGFLPDVKKWMDE